MSEEKLEQLLRHVELNRKLLPTWWIDPVTGHCACIRGEQCRKPGKHPRIKEWQHRASCDQHMIIGWCTAWPLANWGWVQDRTFAIDFDPGRGGLDSLGEWIEQTGGPLTTLTQDTPSGGMHLIYRQPTNDPLPQVDDFMPGVEVRGVGAYIMIDPSHDARGAWKLRPDTVKWLGVQDCDEQTLALIRTRMHGRITRDGSGRRVEDRSRRSDLPPTARFKRYGFGFHSGSRNIDAYRLFWRLLAEVDNRKTTLNDAQVDMYVCWRATTRGDDPFTWDEVVDCMRSAHSRRERQKREQADESTQRRTELAKTWAAHEGRWGTL